MKLFIKALIKSLFGDLANTASVTLGLLIAAVFIKAGDPAVAGWVMVVELLIALFLLVNRYGE